MTNADTIVALAGGLLPVRRCLASLCRGRIRMDHGAYPEDMEIEDGYPSDARVEEIARLLAGARVSETTRRQARELLRAAGDVAPSSEQPAPASRRRASGGGR